MSLPNFKTGSPTKFLSDLQSDPNCQILRRLSHLERKFSLRVQTETTLLITLLSIALNCKARRGLLSDMKNSIGLRAVSLDIW